MADQVSFNIIINGVPQTIKSLADVDTTMGKLRNQYKRTESQAGRTALALKMGNLKGMQTQMMGVGTAMGQMGNQTNQAGVAMQNMNFVIRDSPYFFKDFQLGVLAVGNNMNPLIDSFQRLKMQATEMNKTYKETVTAFGLLKKSMVGPMGLSVAMSIIVTAIQAIVFSMGRSKDAVKEANDEIDKQIDKYGQLSRAGLVWAKVEAMLKIEGVWEEARRKRAEELEKQKREGGSYWGDGLRDTKELAEYLTESQKEHIQLLEKAVSFAEHELKFRGVIPKIDSAIKKIREEINLLTEKDLAGNKKAIILKETEIKNLEEYKKTLRGIEDKTGGGKEQLTVLQQILKTREDNKLTLKQIQLALDSQLLTQREIFAVEKDRWTILNGMEEIRTRLRGTAYFDKEYGEGKPGAIGETGEASKEIIEKNTDAMKIYGAIANQTGTLVSQAFMNGTIQLDRFLASLLATIAQMLIMKALSEAMSAVGLFAGIAGGPLTAVAGIAGMALKRSAPVLVQGKITSDKNNFIANIRNADNYYSRNEEFVVIGR